MFPKKFKYHESVLQVESPVTKKVCAILTYMLQWYKKLKCNPYCTSQSWDIICVLNGTYIFAIVFEQFSFFCDREESDGVEERKHYGIYIYIYIYMSMCTIASVECGECTEYECVRFASLLTEGVLLSCRFSTLCRGWTQFGY